MALLTVAVQALFSNKSHLNTNSCVSNFMIEFLLVHGNFSWLKKNNVCQLKKSSVLLFLLIEYT